MCAKRGPGSMDGDGAEASWVVRKRRPRARSAVPATYIYVELAYG